MYQMNFTSKLSKSTFKTDIPEGHSTSTAGKRFARSAVLPDFKKINTQISQ